MRQRFPLPVRRIFVGYIRKVGAPFLMLLTGRCTSQAFISVHDESFDRFIFFCCKLLYQAPTLKFPACDSNCWKCRFQPAHATAYFPWWPFWLKSHILFKTPLAVCCPPRRSSRPPGRTSAAPTSTPRSSRPWSRAAASGSRRHAGPRQRSRCQIAGGRRVRQHCTMP